MYSHELVQIISEQPYCYIQYLVERDVAKRQKAWWYIIQLAAIARPLVLAV